jgi:hypothetical protein
MKMSGNEKDQSMDTTRDKVQNWLMSEGWQLAEPTHPDFAWLIRAEDGGERRILVGQSKAREDRIHLEANVRISEDHRKQFESLAEERRRKVLWDLRFQLLQLNVDFVGVAEPLEEVILTQRIYLDGLTKDAFIQRFLTVRNAVIAVIWSTIKDLMDVKPPAKSTEKTEH